MIDTDSHRCSLCDQGNTTCSKVLNYLTSNKVLTPTGWELPSLGRPSRTLVRTSRRQLSAMECEGSSELRVCAQLPGASEVESRVLIMCSTILQRATVFYKWRLGIVAVKEKTRSELETRSTMETASTLTILALTENSSVTEGKIATS